MIGPIGKGVGITFGIQDFTKEAEDELLRKEIVQLLEKRGIGMGELAWKARRLYIAAGSPEGPGPDALVRWIEGL